jgi:hypothetical protein
VKLLGFLSSAQPTLYTEEFKTIKSSKSQKKILTKNLLLCIFVLSFKMKVLFCRFKNYTSIYGTLFYRISPIGPSIIHTLKKGIMFIKIIQLTIGFIMLSIFNVAIAGYVINSNCKWSNNIVNWYYNSENQPASFNTNDMVSKITAAADAWASVSGLRFQYQGVTTTSPFTLNDNIIVIAWGNSKTPGWDFSDSQVGAYVTYSCNGGNNKDAYMMLNTDRVAGGQPIQSWQGLITHEFGHIVGLDHSSTCESVMAGNAHGCSYQSTVYQETLRPDDIAGIQSLYPKPSEIFSVKDFWHKADPIYTNSPFDAQFKLQNNSQSGITVKSIAMSIHDSNNTFLFDMYLESNVYIAAGSYHQIPKSDKNMPSKAGTYQVVAKIQEDNNNWKELKSDPFVVHPRSDSSNNDKASQYIDKCISTLSQYCGSKVGEKYSCKENSLCQETTGGQLANVTNIAIDKNITGNQFYYYWDTYGGWSKNGLSLSYCGITKTDNSANKADGFENRWQSSVKLTVDGNNSWKVIDKNDGYFNICQSSNTNKCLHNEYGSLQLSDIQSGWYSAQWYFEDAENGYIRIRNKWKQSEYIHIEYGSPAVGGIESGWFSAQWKKFKF